MKVDRRVLVSGPRDKWLDRRGRSIKNGVIGRIRAAGYEAQYFDPPGGGGDLQGKVWNLDHVDAAIRRCVGVVILGLVRWQGADKGKPFFLPSEYCHYEGSLAYTYDLPILALAETHIEPRGIFIPYGLPVVSIPSHADARWLKTRSFADAFSSWRSELEQRRDVFLGYSSRAKRPAAGVKSYLRHLGLSVLDWQEDFAPAGTILERIREASARCSAGVFLFTRDDLLKSSAHEAAPRDNVVFEAGFFKHAKGQDRVLIIREGGAKMPADLGGDIYATLTYRSDLRPIRPVLRKFAACL